MAYKIIGNANVTGHLTVQGKNVGFSITTTDNNTVYTADINGHVDLPVPQRPEIDTLLSEIPISQYGAVNAQPIGVSGTFDGGSTPPFYSSMPVLLENDGTLVYLRPGTNGSSVNYYYTTINSPDSSTTPYTSIRKYYTGSWDNIVFYDSDAKNTLVYEEVGNQVMHVVLTNGTLDKSKHQEATFAKSLIPNYICSATLAGNYVYIIALYSSAFIVSSPFTQLGYNDTDQATFIVYRIPVSQIQAGNITTVEQVSGITGSTMYGDASTNNGLKLAETWSSPNTVGTKSFIKYDPISGLALAPYTYNLVGSGKSYFDGTNIIFLYGINSFAVNKINRYDTMYGIQIKYNIQTNTYTHDLTPTPITLTGTDTTALVWTNPYFINSDKTYGYNSSLTDGNVFSMYITDNGIQYAIKDKYLLEDTYRVTRCTINNFTTKADAYNFRTRTLTLTSRTEVLSDFASRVGDQLAGGSPISPTRILFSGTGTYQGIKYTKYKHGVADIGTTSNFTYNSVNLGTRHGYAPQSFRVPFGDTNENSIMSKISYHTNGGEVLSYGTAFIEDGLLTVGSKLDPTSLTYDTTITISNSVMQSLKNSIISSLGLTVSASKIGIYFSPRTDYCKSIACVTTANVGQGSGGNIIAATVDCVLTGNTITSATLNTVFVNKFYDNIVAPVISSEIFCKSGLSCVKYGDMTYISFTQLHQTNIPGDLREYSICGVISGNTVNNAIVSYSYHSSDVFGISNTDFREYSYLPNVGFGYYVYGTTDKSTRLVFRTCGNTLAQFNANIGPGTPVGEDLVVIAQDVPEGFFVYFTEVTPLFMNGKYYDLPITAIDLGTITPAPANKLYYAYIQIQNGLPVNVISTTEIPESLTNMFIGTFKTDGTKVSELNISKVSRIGIYRPSINQIGSAFPVSTGNPQQNGTINW